jgi:hypothetical protein
MASEETFEQREQQLTKKMASEEMVLVESDHGDFAPRCGGEIMGGPGWGQCTNLTNEILIVYGPEIPKDPSNCGNSMYFLPPGCTTPDNWDCDGFYVPNDRVAKPKQGSSHLSSIHGSMQSSPRMGEFFTGTLEMKT